MFSTCNLFGFFFPPVKPGPPVVTIATITHSAITLTWSTMLYCFESEIITFVVIWNESGNVTTDTANTTVSPYTISGLQPNTSYEISIKGVTGSGVVSEARALSTTTGVYMTTTVLRMVDVDMWSPSRLSHALAAILAEHTVHGIYICTQSQ